MQWIAKSLAATIVFALKNVGVQTLKARKNPDVIPSVARDLCFNPKTYCFEMLRFLVASPLKVVATRRGAFL
jgi:hypothetical protein